MSPGRQVETFDPAKAPGWAEVQALVGAALAPGGRGRARTGRIGVDPRNARRPRPGEPRPPRDRRREKAVYEWSARVLGTRESAVWENPLGPITPTGSSSSKIAFDGEPAVETPLGDFFGSGPGVNPYENLFFTVDADRPDDEPPVDAVPEIDEHAASSTRGRPPTRSS